MCRLSTGDYGIIPLFGDADRAMYRFTFTEEDKVVKLSELRVTEEMRTMMNDAILWHQILRPTYECIF